MKKILLVSGDSFTDKNWYSDFYPDLDTSWPKWPELLGEKYDMKVVNLGFSGAGNEYIYHSILDYLTDTPIENIGLVIAAWSQCHRKDYQEYGVWRNERIDPHGDIFGAYNKTLRHYLSFQIMCERYNLPYKQFQMIEPFNDFLNGLKPRDVDIVSGLFKANEKMFGEMDFKSEKITQLTKNIMWWERTINTENFWGWPVAKTLQGQVMSNQIEKDLRVSSFDSHPNRLGQQKIMEILYDWMGPRILSE